MAAEISHIYDVKEYAKLGVRLTPAVIVDETVIVSGKVPTVEELKTLLSRQGEGAILQSAGVRLPALAISAIVSLFEAMKNVLFVCVENSCRSQMAEGWARRLAGDHVNVFSAGSRPSGKVNEGAITVMRERGIDLSAQASKGFDALPDLTWDYVITMGCGDECPFVPARTRLDWDLPDPKGKPLEFFREVRDEIERRVKQLLSSLQ